MANLRAVNYKLEEMDWLQVKLKAGRIVPALATTTAAIAGLQTLEMIKLLKGMELGSLRNTFLNLAVPNMMMSEPGEPLKVQLTKELTVNLWDRWEVKGFGKATSLENIISHIKSTHSLECRDVIYGSTTLLMNVMFKLQTPEQQQETLSQPLLKLAGLPEDTAFIDLTITMVDPDSSSDNQALLEGVPTVRVLFE